MRNFKPILLGFLLWLFVLMLPVQAADLWWRSCLIGGTNDCLDSIDGDRLNDGDGAFVFRDNAGTYEVYFYRLEDTAGASDAPPTTILPDTNPGNKSWKLAKIFGSGMALFRQSDGTPIIVFPTAPPTTSKAGILQTNDTGVSSWVESAISCVLMGTVSGNSFECATPINARAALDLAPMYSTPTDGHFVIWYYDDITDPANPIWTISTGDLPATDNTTNGKIVKKVVTGGTHSLEDASAGTDYSSPSSSETFTNKTFDAAGTNNVLKQKKYLILPSPKRCDETGATIDTTKTNATYGQCLFSASAAYTANYAEYMLTVPEDIDTTIAMQGRFKFQLSGGDTGNHCYKIGMYVAANSAAAAYTGSNVVSMGFSGDGSGAAGDIEDTGLVTLTDWAAAMTAGRLLVVRVGRDGGNENDGACGSGAGSLVTSYSGPLVIGYTSSQ